MKTQEIKVPAFLLCFLAVSLFLLAADDDVLPRIFQVIKAAKIDELKSLIAAGESVNQETGHFGETPLMYAAERSTPEIVELLIAKGAKVNKATITGTTALHKASFWGRVEHCQLLIRHGADVNAKKEDGSTPLHEAVMGSPDYQKAKRKNLEVCELLVKSGADINARRAQGKTALGMAMIQSRFQRKQIAEYLQKLHAQQ